MSKSPMPLTLKILFGMSVFRIAVFVIFDILLLVFLAYDPQSGFLSVLRSRMAERLIGDQSYNLMQALNAVAVVSIGAILLAPVVVAIKTRTKKWSKIGMYSLILLLLTNLVRIRIYSVPLDIVSLVLLLTKGSRKYLNDD